MTLDGISLDMTSVPEKFKEQAQKDMERILEGIKLPEGTEQIESFGGVEMEELPLAPVAYAPEMSLPASSGMKIILKNAKIYAEKVIIKRK